MSTENDKTFHMKMSTKLEPDTKLLQPLLIDST